MPTTPSHPGPGRRSVQAVTTARLSVEQDRKQRMRRYLIAMAVRIVGFPVSVWLLVNDYWVPGLLLAVFATVMPSIAVVVANAVDHRGSADTPTAPEPVRLSVEPGPDPTDSSSTPPSTTADEAPIVGTVVSSRAHPTPSTDEGQP